MNSIYLKEALRIGDQLLSSSHHDEYGMSWETMELPVNDKTFWQKSESIYAGVSGIALFFIELYKQTSDKKYLQIAKDAMHWVEWYCENNPVDSYAFLTGRMGVSYTFLKLYQATNDKNYLHKALMIAKQSSSFLKNPYKIYEFINGLSGTTLALLDLYKASQEPWLLEIIKEYIADLISHAKYSKVGLFWDSNDWQIRPLCGFSHGSGGIGFVFLELGNYFKNPAFYLIAEQAFAYENYYFDKKIGNWPDFRVNIYTEDKINESEKAYENKQMQIFLTPRDMNAWCHGAAGIGLSRLRAYKLLKKEVYKKDLERALIKTRSTGLPAFTLCHGNGGNAEIFIENYLTYGDQKSLEQAKSIADKVIEQKKELGRYTNGMQSDETREDLSLFNGIAGVGYFLLRVHDPKNTPSILIPKINEQASDVILNEIKNPLEDASLTLSMTESQIKSSLIENIFPRTIHLAKQFAQEKTQDHFKKDLGDISPKTFFISFIAKLISGLPGKQKQQLKEVFDLELCKDRMIENNKSNALLFIKQRVTQKNAQKLLELSDNNLLKLSFVLSEESAIVPTKTQGNFLLKLTAYGSEEIPINQFCEIVLNGFKKPKSVKDVIKNTVALYNSQSEDEEIETKKQALEQIREAIKYAVILPATKSSG